MGQQSFFLSPMAARDEANAAHAAFAVEKSDLLTYVKAYDAWTEIRQRGRRFESEFCRDNFLSMQTLNQVRELRTQYSNLLKDIGFASRGHGSSENSNAKNLQIIKAALCAGLYPRVVKVVHPKTTYHKMEHGAIANDNVARELKVGRRQLSCTPYLALLSSSCSTLRRCLPVSVVWPCLSRSQFYTKGEGRVFLHPSSINFNNSKYETQVGPAGLTQTSEVHFAFAHRRHRF